MRFGKIITLSAALVLVGALSAPARAQPLIQDGFEDGDVAGWVAPSPGPYGNGTFEAATSPVPTTGGNYAARHIFGHSCYGWNLPLDPITPDYASWYFRTDGDTGHPGGVGVLLHGGMTYISYHQGYLRYNQFGVNGVAYYVPIVSASQGVWYLIQLRNIDWDAKTFDIWVDGAEEVIGAPFSLDTATYIDRVTNHACPSMNGPAYVDEVTLGDYYGFDGFASPVNNDVVNVAKAGRSIPMKFRVTDHEGAPVTDLTSPPVQVTSRGGSCGGTSPSDAIETYAGGSGLQNLGDGYYQFNWKTPKRYAGECRTMMLSLGDLSTHTAEFQFT